MVLAWGSGFLEGHLHFQRDFLLIHCKKNYGVSRHRINSLGLIVCEWFPAKINLSENQTWCCVYACKNSTYEYHLVPDEMQFPAGSLFISTMVSLCIL